jgi:hypothetical protein
MNDELEGLRETSFRTVGVPVDIRTEHHPNTNLEHYFQTSFFGETVYFLKIYFIRNLSCYYNVFIK